MKKIFYPIVLMAALAHFSSCEKDEGKLPNISFKTGASYISTDTSLPAGTSITIGIEASKSEKKDVLRQFNISRSSDGKSAVSAYDQTLTGSDGDNYSYDYTTKADSLAGQSTKYTFTVTNRDGLINQVSLTVKAQ